MTVPTLLVSPGTKTRVAGLFDVSVLRGLGERTRRLVGHCGPEVEPAHSPQQSAILRVVWRNGGTGPQAHPSLRPLVPRLLALVETAALP